METSNNMTGQELNNEFMGIINTELSFEDRIALSEELQEDRNYINEKESKFMHVKITLMIIGMIIIFQTCKFISTGTFSWIISVSLIVTFLGVLRYYYSILNDLLVRKMVLQSFIPTSEWESDETLTWKNCFFTKYF